MNEPKSRRQFLANVSKGTVAATIGTSLASELGLVPAAFGAEEGPGTLHFGELESLVGFMQDTPIDRLQPQKMVKLRQGVPQRRLLAAGVLANARSIGGEDNIGFHTLKALSPALSMSAHYFR
jgi:hypothetical protein